MPVTAALITPENRELMAEIERLGAECKAEQPGAGYTRAQQEYSIATYWGAPKLVELLRAIEAASGETHDLMCSDQLVLDLAA